MLPSGPDSPGAAAAAAAGAAAASSAPQKRPRELAKDLLRAQMVTCGTARTSALAALRAALDAATVYTKETAAAVAAVEAYKIVGEAAADDDDSKREEVKAAIDAANCHVREAVAMAHGLHDAAVPPHSTTYTTHDASSTQT